MLNWFKLVTSNVLFRTEKLSDQTDFIMNLLRTPLTAPQVLFQTQIHRPQNT